MTTIAIQGLAPPPALDDEMQRYIRLAQAGIRQNPTMYGGPSISGLQPGDTVTGPGPSFSDAAINAVSSPGLLSGGEPNRGDGSRPAGRRRRDNDDLSGSEIYGYPEDGVPIPTQDTIAYFNQTYGTNFKDGVDYLNWVYGGGTVVPPGQTNASGIPVSGFIPATGSPAKTVNTPLDYSPATTGFNGFMEKAIPATILGMAGGAATGLIPGTTAIGAAGAGAGATAGAVAGEAAPWYAGLTDMAGGSLAAPEAAGAAYAGGSSWLPSVGSAYEGLGYTAEEIAALEAGTYAGAEQTAAQSLSQLGELYPLTQTPLSLYPGAPPGTSPGGTPGAPGIPNPGTAATGLSKFLNGDAGFNDYADLLGKLLPAGLGAWASSNQADAYTKLADEYKGFGAPYRQRLSDLYADPNSFLSSKEVQVPVQQGTDIMARSLSMKGNPAGSGNALQQLQSYSSDQLFGKLGQEKDRLAGFGGLASYNAAAPTAAAGAIGQNGNMYNAIGSGMANIFEPPKTAAQSLAELQKVMQSGGYNYRIS